MSSSEISSQKKQQYMSLDFSLMGISGAPEEHVSLHLNSWSHIIKQADEGDSPMLERMTEYYQDATYEPAELPELIAELERVRENLAKAEGTASAMLALCRKAMEKQASVMAVAD